MPARPRSRAPLHAALGAAAAAVSVLSHGTAAHAQAPNFRVDLGLGAAGYPSPLSTAPLAVALARAEASVSPGLWIFLGGYGQTMGFVGENTWGWGAGGFVSFRPRLPVIPLAPFAVAGYGYQRIPVGRDTLSEAGVFELDAGLSFFPHKNVDIDLRGGLLALFPRRNDQVQQFGGMGTVGVAFHL